MHPKKNIFGILVLRFFRYITSAARPLGSSKIEHQCKNIRQSSSRFRLSCYKVSLRRCTNAHSWGQSCYNRMKDCQHGMWQNKALLLIMRLMRIIRTARVSRAGALFGVLQNFDRSEYCFSNYSVMFISFFEDRETRNRSSIETRSH